MKVKVNNYTFDKTAKTVTFTDYVTIRLDSILLVTNVTDNIIIYNFANAALGGNVSANVLTLDYDTSAMDNSDKLQIFYENDDVALATETTQLYIRDQIIGIGYDIPRLSSIEANTLETVNQITNLNTVTNSILNDSSSKKAIRLDEASASVFYVGEAELGSIDTNPVWSVFRYTTSGTVLTKEWSGLNQIWNDRASLTYT